MSIIGNLIDSKLTAARLVGGLSYVLVFKTTNFCWYNCPHCCENSDHKQPKTYIPSDAIKHYLTQAKSDPRFSNNVVLTGGEIMTSYLYGPRNYVPELLNFCLDNNIGTDIKTNGAWTRAKFGRNIYDDLTRTISSHGPYGLQISLSLDKYHPNSVDNCARVITHFATKPDQRLIIHLTGFSDMENDLNKLFIRLNNTRGITLNDININGARAVGVNRQVIVKYNSATLFNGGRAQTMADAHKNPFPQFSFMLLSGEILIAFDTMGNVSLGENSGRKIRTSWRTSDGAPRPLNDILHSLVNHARYEEMRAIIRDGWHPIKIKTK